jgi:hypothetical protein
MTIVAGASGVESFTPNATYSLLVTTSTTLSLPFSGNWCGLLLVITLASRVFLLLMSLSKGERQEDKLETQDLGKVR